MIGVGNARVITAALAALLLLVGCSGPKGTVIPSDPKNWDSISGSVKKLSDEDKVLFTGYAMRMTMASALGGGKGGIPPGTTIGDAIKAQGEFLAKQKADEAQADLLKAKVAALRAAEVAKLGKAATVILASLDVLPKNYDAGRFSDRLSMIIGVENHTPKAISGIKGAFVFKDQFDTEITTIRLSLDEDVAAGATRTISNYGKDINQFEDSDQKLAVTPLNKMHVFFEPEMIVFADGSSMKAPDAPNS